MAARRSLFYVVPFCMAFPTLLDSSGSRDIREDVGTGAVQENNKTMMNGENAARGVVGESPHLASRSSSEANDDFQPVMEKYSECCECKNVYLQYSVGRRRAQAGKTPREGRAGIKLKYSTKEGILFEIELAMHTV